MVVAVVAEAAANCLHVLHPQGVGHVIFRASHLWQVRSKNLTSNNINTVCYFPEESRTNRNHKDLDLHIQLHCRRHLF